MVACGQMAAVNSGLLGSFHWTRVQQGGGNELGFCKG